MSRKSASFEVVFNPFTMPFRSSENKFDRMSAVMSQCTFFKCGPKLSFNNVKLLSIVGVGVY